MVFSLLCGVFGFENELFYGCIWGCGCWMFCWVVGVNLRIVSVLCVEIVYGKYKFKKKDKKSVLCEKKCVHLRSYSA